MENKDYKIIKEILAKNNLPDGCKVTRFPSGQINRVYDVDGKYVIKIEGELSFAQGVTLHQPEVTERLLKAGAKVPRIFDHGNILGKNYLLMEKVKGEPLSHCWYKLSSSEKDGFMRQIVEQLRIFHSIEYDGYSSAGPHGKTYEKWIDAVQDNTDFSSIKESELPERTKRDLGFMKDFFQKNVHILEKATKPVLIHQDLHLENVFFEEDELTGIIDFDWSRQAPREFDLWIMISFFHSPQYFVENDLKKHYLQPMKEEAQLLRKHYPELFEADQLADRIRLYLVADLIDWIVDYQSGRWSENVLDRLHHKVHDFYCCDWLEKFLFE